VKRFRKQLIADLTNCYGDHLNGNTEDGGSMLTIWWEDLRTRSLVALVDPCENVPTKLRKKVDRYLDTHQ